MNGTFAFPMTWLLQGSGIHKKMYGLAPRNFMPAAWWYATRMAAKEAFSGKCWACGQAEAKEAHETYLHIGVYWVYSGTAGLCVKCHKFIHIGRQYMMYKDGKVTSKGLYNILRRGCNLLFISSLRPSWRQLDVIGRMNDTFELQGLDVSVLYCPELLKLKAAEDAVGVVPDRYGLLGHTFRVREVDQEVHTTNGLDDMIDQLATLTVALEK